MTATWIRIWLVAGFVSFILELWGEVRTKPVGLGPIGRVFQLAMCLAFGAVVLIVKLLILPVVLLRTIGAIRTARKLADVDREVSP